MPEGTASSVGQILADNVITLFEDTQYLRGKDQNDADDVMRITSPRGDYTLPSKGIVEADTFIMEQGVTHEIEDFLAIFARDKITIKGATFDGKGGTVHDDGVFGQQGVFTGKDWLHYAYYRVLSEQLLDLNVEFERPFFDSEASGDRSDYTVICGAGKVSGYNGGAALLLAAPRVQIQTPSEIDLRGDGDGSVDNDGHFGVLYSDNFIFDGVSRGGGHDTRLTPVNPQPKDI